MPFVVLGVFSVTAPENVKALFTDPIGTYILIASLVLMGLGSLVIMKVVSIKA
jgi:Flp pilus assembly protein TadB